ncbi:MAG TPA: M20/M25/M40 family metallo-hydrolase [Pyrinomonadaceae bacterium]|nr:M20/M25/M40 family metallo-hydrolase [Pyrinomonadaceae bacterium]
MTNRLLHTTLILVLTFFITIPVAAQRNAPITEQNIRAELGFLASDAMQGRGSGTIYERIAAEYIASQFRQFGLEPGGDTDSAGNKDYVQSVSLKSSTTWNVIGVLKGSQPGEAIMLSAHLDHLGVRNSLTGDKIFNGADDDASGCVAVLELARVLAAGKRPKRTIYFICFGSEEIGGDGSQYFIEHSPLPLTQIIADLTFEMLGRPDAKVPAGTLWLTGFERSNLGPELARHGAALVADPHPEQNFFRRSDNYPLALRGVIAHTVSSFGLHKDYHRVSDEISKIDFPFMTRSLNSLVKPVQWLANSNFRPAWLPGQAPTR